MSQLNPSLLVGCPRMSWDVHYYPYLFDDKLGVTYPLAELQWSFLSSFSLNSQKGKYIFEVRRVKSILI